MKILLWLAPFLLFCPSLRAQEILRISSGVSPVKEVFSRVSVPFEKATGIHIQLVQKDPKGTGTDLAFMDMDQGRAEAGAGGTHWEGLLSLLKEKGYTPASKLSEYKNRVIGKDLIRIYTFKGGPKELSEGQVKALFIGMLKNWKNIGGPDLPVIYMRSAKMPATEKFLLERILHLAQEEGLHSFKIQVFGPEVEVEQYLSQIGSTPGAFGIGPNYEGTEVNVPKVPSFGRPITLFWKGAPSANLQKFLQFMEGEGKTYVPH